MSEVGEQQSPPSNSQTGLFKKSSHLSSPTHWNSKHSAKAKSKKLVCFCLYSQWARSLDVDWSQTATASARLTMIGCQQDNERSFKTKVSVLSFSSSESKSSEKVLHLWILSNNGIILREITLWLGMEGAVFVTNTSVIVTFKEFNKRFAAISAIKITNFVVSSPVAISISNIMPSPATWLHEISDFLKNLCFYKGLEFFTRRLICITYAKFAIFSLFVWQATISTVKITFSIVCGIVTISVSSNFTS